MKTKNKTINAYSAQCIGNDTPYTPWVWRDDVKMSDGTSLRQSISCTEKEQKYNTSEIQIKLVKTFIRVLFLT